MNPDARLVFTVVAMLAASAVSASQSPPNLVLITLDTTRADHLGAWGWSHARTPHLDALAARGVRFANCDAPAPITLPSHASILTGLYPPRHGVRDNGTFALAASFTTVAERLRAAGYDTAAIVSAVVLARRHGLDQGFRIYDDDLGTGYDAGTVVGERTAEATTESALGVVAGLAHPFFLWVHFYDPHEEYRPPTRFADSTTGPHRLYDGEIAFMDEQIGRLLAQLPSDSVVLAVGDHGEMLGEHSELTHGILLHRGARRVPLLLAGPGLPSGRTVDCLVSAVDVAPTLLALGGTTAFAEALDGESLLPVLDSGAQCHRTTYSESFLPFFAYKWYPLRALSDDRFFFLKAPRSSLYYLEETPEETRDLATSQPQAVASWERRLSERLAAMGESLEPEIRPENVVAEEQRRQLQSLGYLGGGGGGRISGELPDPRARVEIAQQIHRLYAAVREGGCREALRELAGIVERDPHNFPALNLAGLCLKESGRPADALALFRRASAENELSAVPVANVAGALLALGRRAEAEKEYRHALALDPAQGEAAANLARLLREGQRAVDALPILDAAVANGARGAEVFLERGLAQTDLGRLAPALADFRAAARRAPTDPVPLENAARTAYQLGQARAAAQIYEQLLRLTPNRLDLWKTVGAIYLSDLDERESALASFRHALGLEFDPVERAKLETVIAELSE